MNVPDVLRRHEGSVFALCWRVLRHRQDAEDAAQEVLLKAARELPRLEDPSRVVPWLHRVALNAALDARRRRERLAAREHRASALALPATPDEVDRDALHRALALLDDDDRAVVVEHYFQRRTLKEIADAEGCSEPAVWKRVERAKEKLRRGLAAAAPTALPRMDALLAEPAAAPAFGGLPSAAVPAVAATGVASKVAVVLVLLLAGAAGAAAWLLRDGEAPPGREPRIDSASARPAAPAPADPSPAAAAPEPAVEPVAAPDRPYPFRMPPPRWPEAKRRTWSSIRKTRVTIDLQNAPLNEILADITRQCGQGFRVDADVQPELQIISFKVSDIQVDGALRLMLQPRQFGHVVLDDGGILVAREASLEAYRDAGELRIRQALADLDEVRKRVENGWNGAEPFEPVTTRLGAERIALGSEPDTLGGWLDRLQKAGVYVSSDWLMPREELPRPLRELHEAQDRIAQEELRAAFQGKNVPDPVRLQEMERRVQERVRRQREESLDKRALGLSGERPVKDWLDRIAAEWGLGWFPRDEGGSVGLSSPARAEQMRREAAAARAAHVALVARLDRPLPADRPAGVPGLVDAMSRELGLELIASEAAWSAAPPSGKPATWRELLDGLAERGLRWAVHDGKLVLVGAP